jgi:hypothetical protein
MKSLTSKLLLSALGIALIATPALAQRPHRNAPPRQANVYPVPTYPNPVTRSGSAESVESGAAFNLDYGYGSY